jgi:hypothetical protein
MWVRNTITYASNDKEDRGKRALGQFKCASLLKGLGKIECYAHFEEFTILPERQTHCLGKRTHLNCPRAGKRQEKDRKKKEGDGILLPEGAYP